MTGAGVGVSVGALILSVALPPVQVHGEEMRSYINMWDLVRAQYPASNINGWGSQSVVLSEPKAELANTSVWAQEAVFSPDSGPVWTSSEAHLYNDSNLEQTFYTQSYTKTYTDTYSVSVLDGGAFTTTTKMSVTGKVPVGEVMMGAEFSWNQNWGTTTTETKWETNTYTIPSQPVRIPPRKTARISASLWGGKATGTFRISGDVTGTYSAAKYAQWGSSEWRNNSLQETIIAAQDNAGPKGPTLPSTLTVDLSNRKVKFRGDGTYSATLGTKFMLKVCIVEDGCTPTTKTDIKPKSGSNWPGVFPYPEIINFLD
ncbi:ETX/MTX2 family pore-forming toxin [Streptomyces sp. NPDC127084]|uniref:ETX/MTX2 family pore-forming toxin n=1 Tax=Streptomyces sp. NPDC127084 TaxID=3347133 RepID=UPI00366178C1